MNSELSSGGESGQMHDPKCPASGEWGLYTAGLLPEKRAAEMTEHASTCSVCGPLLADLYAEEEPDTALRSASEAWQRAMSEKLAGMNSGVSEKTPETRNVVAFPRGNQAWLVAAAVLALVAGGSLWFYRAGSPAAAFDLLARSYSEQRPFPYRMPGGAYQPLRAERGAVRQPSPPLLEAQALIAKKLRAKPDAADWLRARARAELMELRYSGAIDDLKNAQQGGATGADLDGDFGLAFLERYEAEHRELDREEAIRRLAQALAENPRNPVFLFNRALAEESSHQMLRAAVDDWHEFLQVEPSGGWADEAKEHLRQDEDALRQHGMRQRNPGRGEQAILPLARRGFRGDASFPVKDIALDLAGNHRDPWLADFVAANGSSASQRASALVARAGEALASGSASAASELWPQTAQAFLAAGNRPGALFAAVEETYTLQRLSKPDECARTASETEPQLRRLNYKWLEIQLMFALSGCMSQQGRFETAYRMAMSAEQIAEEAGYETLAMQGMGARSSTLRQIGSYREAMQADREGLKRYWAGQGDTTRAYQFYYGLATSASALGEARAADALMREAVELARLLPDRSVEAMVRGRYGETLADEGQLAAAEREFSLSAALFGKLADSPSLRLYKARAEISKASLDVRNSHLAEGLERVRRIDAAGFEKNALLEAQSLRVKSDLLTRAGRMGESEDCLRRILALGDSQPTASVKISGSAALAREMSSAVGILTDRFLARGDATGALRLWRTYNPCCRAATADPSAVKLVYADLPGGLVVWVDGAAGVQVRRLRVSVRELSDATANFRRAVSDPGTSVDAIRRTGRLLARELVSPAEGLLRHARTLYIAGGAPFDRVPFQALVGEDGAWLADKFQIVYSPLVGAVTPHDRFAGSGRANLLAVGSGRSAELLELTLPSLPEVDRDLRSAAGAFPRNVQLSDSSATRAAILHELPGAEVLHFSGHAVVTARDAALVVSDADGGDRTLWVSALKPGDLRRCRLAVLAACSTGRAPDEDSDPSAGMARDFLALGVPEVIAARWDVDSAATSRLMQEFYAQLKAGADAQSALRASAQRLRRQGEYRHPYFWAAFDDFQI